MAMTIILWRFITGLFSLFLLSMAYLTVPIVTALKSTGSFETVMMFFYILFIYMALHFIVRAAVQQLTIYQWIVVTMIFMAYLVLILTTPYAVERIHVLFYSIHGVLYLKTLPEKLRGIKRYLAAGIITAAIGAADELLQIYVPGRFPAVSDVMLNTVSGMLGLVFASKVQSWKLKLP